MVNVRVNAEGTFSQPSVWGVDHSLNIFTSFHNSALLLAGVSVGCAWPLPGAD